MTSAHARATFALVLAGFATSAFALTASTDVVVPAAIHAPGAEGAVWRTDLYLYNPNAEAATLDIEWLARDQPNPGPPTHSMSLDPMETAILEDVVATVFGADPGYGAMRIVSSRPVVVNSAILNSAGGTEFGQGFESIPVAAAVRAGASAAAVALKHDSTYRSNLYLVDVGGEGSEAVVTLVDPTGAVIGSRSYSLGPWMPVLDSVVSLGASSFADATMVVTVTSGAVVAGASRVNATSGDPLTLAAAGARAEGLPAGRYHGTVADPAGFLGGMSLELDAADEVTALQFSFPSALCDVTFGASHDLGDSPIPLSELAAGVELIATYDDGGEMRWTIVLNQAEVGPHLGGTIAAVGSDWSGSLLTCNGVHPPDQVALGVEVE